MEAKGEIRILAAGFGSFPGARFNPAEAIVDRLSRSARSMRSRLGVNLASAVLPVVWDGAQERVRDLIVRNRPDVVLLVGLAGRRCALSVETRARNKMSPLKPDAGKRMAAGSQIEAGARPFRSARLPIAAVVAALSRAGVRAQASIEAGDYLCNQTFYLALGRQTRWVGFVHLPPARDPFSPLSRRPGAGARFSVDEMARALLAVLPALAALARLSSRTEEGKIAA